MPDCHSCPYNGQPTKKCLSCPGPSRLPHGHRGISLISLDTMPEREVAALTQKTAISPKHHHRLAAFMRSWLLLKPVSQNILARFIIDGTATRQSPVLHRSVSRQAIHQHLLRIARDFPELRTVIRLRMNRREKRGNNTKK